MPPDVFTFQGAAESQGNLGCSDTSDFVISSDFGEAQLIRFLNIV